MGLPTRDTRRATTRTTSSARRSPAHLTYLPDCHLATPHSDSRSLTGSRSAATFHQMSFVHLHCHSEYSLLDGANRIDDLIKRALEFEQPALAITDHGNLHAAWEFQEKAKKAKIKPIIGMEAYVAPGDRRTRGRPDAGRQAILPPRAARPRPRRATRTSSSCRRSRTPKASTRSRASTASCSPSTAKG